MCADFVFSVWHSRKTEGKYSEELMMDAFTSMTVNHVREHWRYSIIHDNLIINQIKIELLIWLWSYNNYLFI